MTRDPRPISEEQLQQTVIKLIDYQRAPGVMRFAIPNGIPASPQIGARFKRQGMKAGVGDIEVIIWGRAHFLELKTATGRQSPAQKAFQMECEACQTPYRVARSFDEAREILLGWGALRGAERRAAA